MRRLSDYEPFTSGLLSLMARETRFKSRPRLDQVLAEEPRLIVVFSHSSPLSWLPAPCLLTAHACARGGGARTPVAVMDKFFYSVPPLRWLAEWVSQNEKLLTFEELVERFQSIDRGDLVVFPEGSNCFFGPPEEIQEFRSPRFMELAIRTRTPLLTVVHRGSESWGLKLKVSADQYEQMVEHWKLPEFAQKFLGDRLKRSGLLVLPWLPKPMPRFAMLADLYRPRELELSNDVEIRRLQVAEEAERVRAHMREQLRELDTWLEESASEDARET
jgi:hypothetical protein